MEENFLSFTDSSFPCAVFLDVKAKLRAIAYEKSSECWLNSRTWADVWHCYTHVSETINLIFGLHIEKAFC